MSAPPKTKGKVGGETGKNACPTEEEERNRTEWLKQRSSVDASVTCAASPFQTDRSPRRTLAWRGVGSTRCRTAKMRSSEAAGWAGSHQSSKRSRVMGRAA